MGVPDFATSSTAPRPTAGRRKIVRVGSALAATVASASRGAAESLRPPVAAASPLAGPTWRSLSADAERSERYTCEAAADAKPPINVPMMEPAMPIWEARAKDVAAASPDAITVEKLKSSKRPFLPSGESTESLRPCTWTLQTACRD